MASTSDNAESSKKEVYKERLSKLECPFTWQMEGVSKSINTDYNPHDEEEPFPLLKLLRAIMTVFEETKDDEKDRDFILDNLKQCDDNYRALKIKAHPEISTKVAYAVLQATKCFVYLDLDMDKELDLVYKNLERLDKMNNKDKSTLLGCKSICWSKYHRIGSQKAEQLIREAIKLNEKCDMWYFILGKNIRRQRRDLSMASCPNHEERDCFLKAYTVSKNPTYGIFVAQMYRESKQSDKALKMYNDIYAYFDSLSNAVLLRLALGFIRHRKLGKAKACLDKAEESCAEQSTYLHYRGIYHMKKEEFLEAERYFKRAIRDFNLPAEKQYLECLLQINKSFDATKYLLDLLNKYQSLPNKDLQATILDVAFSYWKREKDLKEAIKYFLRAIEIDPQAKCLTNFYNNDVYPIKDRNVYDFLEKYIFPVITNQRDRFDEATIERVEAIKEFGNINDEIQMNTLGSAFNRINVTN